MLGDIHHGFRKAFESIWFDSPNVTVNGVANGGLGKQLRLRHGRSLDASVRAKPLFPTGHSLGGALATLASVYAYWDACLRELETANPFWSKRKTDLGTPSPDRCEDRGIHAPALYTFGAPRVGGTDFSLMARFAEQTEDWEATSVFRFVHANDLVTKVPDKGFFHACVSRNETQGLIYLPRDADVDVGGVSDEYKQYSWRVSVFTKIGDHGIDLYAKKLLPYAGKVPPVPRLSEARRRHLRVVRDVLRSVRAADAGHGDA